MTCFRIENMTGGWFVGDFEPTLHATNDVEVAVKYYKAGDKEGSHYHKIAKELTVIVSGEVFMCDQKFKTGDVIVLEPGDITSFEALTDAVTTVVKLPCVKGDKYLAD